MRLKFSKMHGLGNDFVIIDRISRDFELTPARIAELGDRRTGIGFDQLLLVEVPRRPDADFFFHIYNADGSEAEQCGNGARAFARYVFNYKLTTKRHLVLETLNGLISAELLDNGLVEIDMGAPGLAEQPTSHAVQLDDGEYHYTPVNMGNPHVVLRVDDLACAPVATLGRALSTHPQFPAGVNVGFAQVIDSTFLRLRVFERGVGETRACGSGACAAVVAGVLSGDLGPRVKVSLPGGKLRIVWHGPGQTVKMTGPTAEVFNGEFKV